MEVDHPKRKKKKKINSFPTCILIFLTIFWGNIDVSVTKDLKSKQIRLLSQVLK